MFETVQNRAGSALAPLKTQSFRLTAEPVLLSKSFSILGSGAKNLNKNSLQIVLSELKIKAIVLVSCQITS